MSTLSSIRGKVSGLEIEITAKLAQTIEKSPHGRADIAVYRRNPGEQMVEFSTELEVWDPKQQRDVWGLPPGPNFLRPPK